MTSALTVVELAKQRGFPRLTLRTVRHLLDTKRIRCVDLANYCYSLAVAGESIWDLNAFCQLADLDTLLDEARQADDRASASAQQTTTPRSALDGIPVSVKANFAVADMPLTAGSNILGADTIKTTPPIGYDAVVVQSLRRSGALLLGCTTMDEFGMGSLGTNCSNGRVARNPLPFMKALSSATRNDNEMVWSDDQITELIRQSVDAVQEVHESIVSHSDEQEEGVDTYLAGGSSCGSAISVAHGSSILSLGSDTGGSVRLPASWCGIVGFKPSYGILSRSGLVSYASSFDTVGILSKSVQCAATGFECLLTTAAQNEQDQDYLLDSTQSLPTKQYLESLKTTTEDLKSQAGYDFPNLRLKGVKVGIPAAFSVSECPSLVKNAWEQCAEYLADHGAQIDVISVDDISPDLLQAALAAYYVLVSAEASSNLSRYDGFRYGNAVDPDSIDWKNLEDFSILEKQYSATRTVGFGREVVRRVLCGTSVLSSSRFHSHYEAAAKVRALLTEQIETNLRGDKFDILMVPTSITQPPTAGAKIDHTEMFANDAMTVPISLTGLPAISVPVGRSATSIFNPGIQLVGPRKSEPSLLAAASVLQEIDAI